MGLDGDHGRDDYGLPPVDIVVPDDARELDREIHAYRREQRQRRRQSRWRRLTRPFTGRAAPIVIGLLLVAVIAASLVAIVSSRTAPTATAVNTNRPPAQPGRIGGPLPEGDVVRGDTTARLRDLRPAVIALVPEGCECDRTVAQLSRQSRELPLSFYVSGIDAPDKEIRRLVRGLGDGQATAVEDRDGLLASTYRPKGLTAVLVHTDGVVAAVLRDVQPGARLEPRLESLQRPGAGVAG